MACGIHTSFAASPLLLKVMSLEQGHVIPPLGQRTPMRTPVQPSIRQRRVLPVVLPTMPPVRDVTFIGKANMDYLS